MQPVPDVIAWRALLRLAAGVPVPALPPGAERLLSGAAAPLSALGRLAAPLASGLAAAGLLDGLAPDVRATLLARRDDAIRADLAARRFVDQTVLAGWPRDIPVALVKGAALNGTAYGDAEPRYARDLDLVVRPADLAPALAHLRARGGRPLDVPRPASPEHALAFEGPLPQQVDLHAGFVDARLFRVRDVAVWARTAPWHDGAATPARRLAPADALAHLAVHALTHARVGARALVDAHRVITRGPLDWASLPSVAGDWQARTPLYALLAAAREVLDAPVPASALEALAPARWRRRLAAVLLRPGAPDAEGAPPALVRRVLAIGLLDDPGPALTALPAQVARSLRAARVGRGLAG